jgi:hypothetical protein
MWPRKPAVPWFELDANPVQRIVPIEPSHRFEGVDFSGCGNILAIATSEANSVLLFRRRPDGRFEDAPYQTIGSATSKPEYPHDVAFSRATADELLAIAERPGRIAIHAKDGAGRYSATSICEIGGARSGLAVSDGVAFVPPDESHLAACNLVLGTISFYRKVSDSPPAFESEPVFQIEHESIFRPDGLAFSGCGRWLAVANHGRQTVAIFRRKSRRSASGALEFRRRPAAVIADHRFRYPHSVAFTPQTNHLLVSNAGANYLCVYAPERRWFGAGWSQEPVAQIMIHDDDAFREVNAANKMEGGPKGIAVHGNTVAACSPQIGVKLYSFREGWR